MTKIVKFILIAVFSIGIIGCKGKSKKSEERISLIVKTPTLSMANIVNPDVKESSDFLHLAAQKFNESEIGKNIDITIEVFAYVNEHKAIKESYGTDSAVDVLYEGYFNMEAYISEGKVVPLNDIITKEIREDMPESSWEQGTKFGKVYMMPFLSMQNILIYNKKLFRDCGLQKYISEKSAIQNWTIKEWEEILDTLAKKLPEGSYPIMMYGANFTGDTHIMSFIRAFGSKIFDEEGNFDFENPKAIKALKWIQDGVERGWYAPHAENLEMIDNEHLFIDGRMGIYHFNNFSFSLYENCLENYGFVNYPNNVATSFITGFEVFDNGDEKKLQAAKKFVKFIYETPELMDYSAGSLPESKKVATKYAKELIMLEEFTANAENVVDFINSSPNWQGSHNSVRNVFYPNIQKLLNGSVTPEQCAADLNRVCNEAIHVEVKYHD